MASARTDPQDGRPSASTGGYDLTIEQLAAETGMSVRNIRNHHTRGLLPPPEVRARVGYYSSEHVARLRLIQDLQADGFNLAAIERLLSGSDGLAARLLGLRHAVTTPFEPESPEVITAEELDKRFGEVDAKDVERVRKLGLLLPLGDGRFEVPSPALLGQPSKFSRWASRCRRRSRWSSASGAIATRSRAPSRSCSSESCGSPSIRPASRRSAGTS